MPRASRNLLAVIGLAVLVFALVFALARRLPPRGLVESAPEGTVLAADLAVPALRRSSLLERWIGARGAGFARLRALCGDDPLDGIDRVQLFVLGGAERAPTLDVTLEEIAIVAEGRLDHERLAACLDRAVEEEGGGVHPTRIEGVDALRSDHGSSVAAFVGRDRIVVGAERVVAEMIRRESGAARDRAPDPELARLLAALDPRAQVRLVAHLPSAWSRTLARATAPFSEGLELEAARALALDASFDEGLALHVRLALDATERARGVADTLARRITIARADPEIATSALGVTLARLSVTADGPDVDARIRLDRAEIDATVALARRWMGSAARADEERGPEASAEGAAEAAPPATE